MAKLSSIRVHEVAPRDGLQDESRFVPTETKLKFIAALASAGCRSIEITAFVNRKKIPQMADAEELKRQVGLSDAGNDPRIKQSLDFTLERILGESLRVLRAYENNTGTKISKVILTGGGVLLKGLLAHATAYFEREATLADPFSKVEYPAFLEDTLKEAGPSFAVALGVALRKLSES